MYESYFGLTGAPFLLNPDPSFYFDSRGHSSALSYLKFGLYQAEGFIVVTGDIGAGKTTLVRTLLSDIDNDKVVAAQLVSTQLEAGDLLRSTITAFGIPPKGQSKAELIATLEAYLTLLATQNKRAVLIVDEAQNLSRDAIEELRMLSNFQFGNQALLQSFLIGQPELRDMLLSRSLEQLRQRVIASYHLGPMDRSETRRYIEHRLKKVGWNDHPHFDDDAFDEIFQWTSGIPRRINLLCNRLLLATFLAEGHDITSADVARIAMEIRAEIGEPTLTRVDSHSIAPTAVNLPEPQRPLVMPTLTDSVEAPLETPKFSNELLNPATVRGPRTHAFLMVAGSRTGCIRAAALQKAFATRTDLPALKLLVINAPGQFELSGDWSEHLGLREPDFVLRVPPATPVGQMADGLRQLDHLLHEYNPAALIVQGGDDAALMASLAAHRQGVPIIHMEAGLRSFDRSRPQEINAMMCDHMADLLLTSEWVAHDNLTREGISADRVQFVGNLVMDTVRAMLPQASPPKYTLRQFDQSPELLKNKQGYGIVHLHGGGIGTELQPLIELTAILKSISRDLPMIWVTNEATRRLINQHHLLAGVDGAQLGVLPVVPYYKMIGLIGTAACVLTDSSTVQEESTILGVPCLTLHNYTERRITVEQGTNIAVGCNSSLIHRAVAEILRGGGKKGRLPKFWDGLTASRTTEHLAAWWKQRAPREQLTNPA
ncbi:MAG TPA: XrtA/PEP-CTERM system-associated ATPase [Aquabacterium sp.]|uniref:XrtA/PEP-CTERM system-associated ATPase n=1 Tax=Aquabacterium sp. TaxID=1872578 RepID=UPI002E31C6B1|nr:XrtA/PEP-CTERM system-associated ATPase [Aquabacterium sp.]HEX5358044.1 XrtA/PEP-CTERM system-associated ATPase [Aquabacterium sp.]